MRWHITLLLALIVPSLHGQNLVNSYRFGSSLNSGLIAYWKLEETSGTRVDSEPTVPAHNLTDNNTVTSTTGIISTAALFTSVNNESLSEADSTDISVADIDFSCVAWVKFTTVAASQDIVSHYSATGNQRSWVMRYNASTGKGSFIVSNNGTATVTLEATAFGNLTTATWYMIFVSHDSVNNLLIISINDSTRATVSHTTGVFDSSAAFRIGENAGGGNPVNGAVDEVGFWKRVLTTAEVTELYNSGAGKTCCAF